MLVVGSFPSPKTPWQAWAEGLPGVFCWLGVLGDMPTATSSTSSRTWATASLGPVRRARPDWRRRAAAILFAFVGEAHPVAARTGSARRRAPADLHRPSPVRGRAERRPAPAAPGGRAGPGRGRRFTRSDSAWLATLPGSPASLVERQGPGLGPPS